MKKELVELKSELSLRDEEMMKDETQLQSEVFPSILFIHQYCFIDINDGMVRPLSSCWKGHGLEPAIRPVS